MDRLGIGRVVRQLGTLYLPSFLCVKISGASSVSDHVRELVTEPKLGRRANRPRQHFEFVDRVYCYRTNYLVLERCCCTTAWYADWAFTWTQPSINPTMINSRYGNAFLPSRGKPNESLTELRICPSANFSLRFFPGTIWPSNSPVRLWIGNTAHLLSLNASLSVSVSVIVELFTVTIERNKYLEERNEELERQVDVWASGAELPP